MKSIWKGILGFALAVFLLAPGVVRPVAAQSDFEDAIKQLNEQNLKGYLQPFANVFSYTLNSGLYRTAHVSKLGLHVYVGLVGVGTLIPDQDKTYMGVPPAPWPQEPVETATVFGGKGATVTGPNGLTFQFQNGQVQGDMVPFAVPQVEIGSFLGTMLRIRYVKIKQGDFPEIKVTGFGIQHSLSQYLFMFPVDVSVGFFRQKLEVGEILSASATSIGLQASKSFVLLTVYGTAAYESAAMDVTYTYEGGPTPQEISLSLKSKGHFRMAVGARLRLGFLIVNGDYSLGSQNSFAIGLGIGL